MERTSISIAELSRLIKKHVQVEIDYAVWRLQQEAVLVRSRRGLYLVKEGEEEAFLKDPIEAILSLLGVRVVFGYGTALYVHGLSRYGLVTEYYILSKADKKSRNVGNVLVRFIKSPVHNEVGIIKQKFGRKTILISNLERTLIDCIHRPKYAQGWENVAHAPRRAGRVNARRLIEYVKVYGIPSLVARVGVVLEHFTSDWKVRSGDLDSLISYLPREPVRFTREQRGKLNKKWNIYVPEELLSE